MIVVCRGHLKTNFSAIVFFGLAILLPPPLARIADLFRSCHYHLHHHAANLKGMDPYRPYMTTTSTAGQPVPILPKPAPILPVGAVAIVPATKAVPLVKVPAKVPVKRAPPKGKNPYDDANCDYKIVLGEVWMDRFEIKV